MARKKQDKSTFTAEFRDTAIKLAMAGDKSTAEVARELGLPEWKLYGWVQTWKKKNSSVEQKTSTSAEERLKQQEKRIKQLEMENEILKKAAAYFAKTLL